MDDPIVVTGWPLVEIEFLGPANESQVTAWLTQMNDLLGKEKPFGLLTRTTEESEFAELGRKALGLWFKQKREDIARWCVGISRIALAEAAVERLAGPKMQAAMPCPIYASVDPVQARVWLEQRLQEK